MPRGRAGPLLFDVASAVMYLGGPAAALPFLSAYAEAGGSVPSTEVRDHLDCVLRYRWAVQADYFASRIAEDDRAGINDAAGNRKGLEDARRRLLEWY